MDIYGEKYSGDSRFVAKCRQLQSIFRVEIGENIRPYHGRDGKVHYYGNYIDGGEVSGANFLTKHAFKHALERIDPSNKKDYETIEPDRLFNNLLSSQPMAFNLFCPLQEMLLESPKAATNTIKAALPYYSIQKVIAICLEYIPEDYKDLTGDKSAMDAIIRFIDINNKEGFIAIETKYSENLGTNIASEKGNAKMRALETIKKIKCFQPSIEDDIINNNVKLTQIYRNFLLSESYGMKYQLDSYSIVMAPKDHPTTKNEVDSLSVKLLNAYKHKLKDVSLEEFVGNIIKHCPNKYIPVFKRFYDRYLNFSKL